MTIEQLTNCAWRLYQQNVRRMWLRADAWAMLTAAWRESCLHYGLPTGVTDVVFVSGIEVRRRA